MTYSDSQSFDKKNQRDVILQDEEDDFEPFDNRIEQSVTSRPKSSSP